MTALTELRNIGSKSSASLMAVGIDTVEELVEVGPVEAYLRAKAAFPDRVSLNLLWALQAGLLDIPWNLLPDAMKTALRKQAGE